MAARKTTTKTAKAHDDAEQPYTGSTLPQAISPDAPIFTVSVAARLAGMHPQTLRTYDRLELVVPRRAKGSGRRYSPRDIAKLRLIQHLSQDEGVNLNGIKRIIELGDQLDQAVHRAEQLAELVQLLTAGLDGEQPGRVFTAGAEGDVWEGRRRHQALALPPGD
ncbi:MAG: helix-turn-helix transcriptional regulator [Propionibacteriaceae bacterium]|nr:helix-turn-helix transcriptional regulator [Propionibacteriaceae bacterium]